MSTKTLGIQENDGKEKYLSTVHVLAFKGGSNLGGDFGIVRVKRGAQPCKILISRFGACRRNSPNINKKKYLNAFENGGSA